MFTLHFIVFLIYVIRFESNIFLVFAGLQLIDVLSELIIHFTMSFNNNLIVLGYILKERLLLSYSRENLDRILFIAT